MQARPMVIRSLQSTRKSARLKSVPTPQRLPKVHLHTVWLSDLHLGSHKCQIRQLLDFLDSFTCDNLYLVGDIIDVISLKRRVHWTERHSEVIQKILNMQHASTRVIYIPGNHDATFRKLIGKVLGGVEIRRRDIYTTRLNQRLLITHGDELDSNVAASRWLRYFGGWAYDRLMKANTLIIQARDQLGMPYWSLAAQIKLRVSRAVEYVESFESGMIALAKKAGVDGVVCGHIHKPEMKTVDGIIYCNDGDWVESCSALVEHNSGELELVLWHDLQSRLAEDQATQRAA